MKIVRSFWGTLEEPVRRRYEANNPLPAGEIRQRAAAHMGVDLLALGAADGDAGAPQPEGQAVGDGHPEGEAAAPQPEA